MILHWFVSFHYTDNKINENEDLKNVADMVNKNRRIAYKNRDLSIKNTSSSTYPKILFFIERCHVGTSQHQTHMIMEKMSTNINTELELENPFRKILPFKMRPLSKWKCVDIQIISCEDKDLRRLISYLGKQPSAI